MKFCVITCTVRTVVLVVNLRQVIQNLKMRFPAETACKIPDSCRDVAVRVGMVRVGGGVLAFVDGLNDFPFALAYTGNSASVL